jgi:regulator of protease activity HflC (stomatin/prohibitin superfamily)
METTQGYKLAGIGAVLALFMVLALWGQLFENVDADQIVVIQAPTSGELNWYTTPGIKWQGFGKVTAYQKLSGAAFENKIMFNDNGTAKILGDFQVELPMDVERLTSLHTKYGSQEAIDTSLVKTTVAKVINMTGPLMSSKEASAERKTDLIRYIADQIEHGVYRTYQKPMEVEDTADLTGKKKRIVMVADIMTKDGQIVRQEESPIGEFGIRIVNFAPRDIDFDNEVKAQIKRQQDITMQVQTAMAQAKEAEQRRITAQADGEAQVMKARYEKEVDKIQAVTNAQRDYEVAQKNAQKELEVARLEAQAAEQTKRKDILLGEGESQRRKLVMAADGALEKRLATYEHVNDAWAAAIKDYNYQLVPSVMMGGDGKVPHATDLTDMIRAKFAHDLSLDFSPRAKSQKGAE